MNVHMDALARTQTVKECFTSSTHLSSCSPGTNFSSSLSEFSILSRAIKEDSKNLQRRSNTEKITGASKCLGSKLNETIKSCDSVNMKSPQYKYTRQILQGSAPSTASSVHFKKPLSSEQSRAVEVQVHAPTHSHSTSRCYCISHNKVRYKNPLSIYSYAQKQHIPICVKKRRYKAPPMQPISKNLRMVHWADEGRSGSTNFDFTREDLSEVGHHKNKSIIKTLFSSHDSQLDVNNLLPQVKTFREQNWLECHAHSESDCKSKLNIMNHYFLNKRLYLESIPAIHENSGLCSHPEGLFRPNTLSVIPAAENYDYHTTVTLPKFLLDKDCYSDQHEMHANRTLTSQIRPVNLQSSCLSMLRNSSLPVLSDSFALIHQNKETS